MKRTIIILIVLALQFMFVFAQNTAGIKDEDAIKAAVLDYADGFYSGDAARMERALHFDLNKAIPDRIGPDERIVMRYSTYSGLVEMTRAKQGFVEEGKRKTEATVININDDIANAKLTSSQFNDYLQLVKIDNQWKIVNVLWTYGMDSRNRIKNFVPADETSLVLKAATNYIEAQYSADTRLLEQTVHPEFNRATIAQIPSTGEKVVNRSWAGLIIEFSIAKIGMVSETGRNYQISVLDIMDGNAVAEIITPSSNEYLQLFKEGNSWKVFHSIMKRNLSYSFLSSVPAVINHQMPDFTLPVYGGGEFNLSKQLGKNVLIVFPRGWIGDHWCQVCHYQYAELMDILKKQNLEKKYNLEIVFVLPYSNEKIADWVDKFQAGLNTVEQWKSPQGQNISQRQKEFADFIRQNYPNKYEIKTNELTIPILVDADRKVSRSLQLFANFWDGIRSEQNIPTIFLVDKTGKVKFKYHSQTTFDRPDAESLVNVIKTTVK